MFYQIFIYLSFIDDHGEFVKKNTRFLKGSVLGPYKRNVSVLRLHLIILTLHDIFLSTVHFPTYNMTKVAFKVEGRGVTAPACWVWMCCVCVIYLLPLST